MSYEALQHRRSALPDVRPSDFGSARSAFRLKQARAGLTGALQTSLATVREIQGRRHL